MKFINEFMNRFSKFGIIVCLLGIILSRLFSKYHLLSISIIIDLLYAIGVLSIGYYIGNTVV